jgi:glycine/D-amino acid oxidase-like deaminating enzyme
MPSNQPPKNIAIIGGGIAGISTAYFLANSPSLPTGAKITVIEGTEIAAAASGKSGGFLAKDWHGTPTASLSEMSYDLHRELADKYGGGQKWGYRTVDTLVRDSCGCAAEYRCSVDNDLTYSPSRRTLRANPPAHRLYRGYPSTSYHPAV